MLMTFLRLGLFGLVLLKLRLLTSIGSQRAVQYRRRRVPASNARADPGGLLKSPESSFKKPSVADSLGLEVRP